MKTALYMRSFHFRVKSVLRQNWCSEWKCLRAFATRVRTSLCEEPSLLRVTPRYLACCSIVRGVPLVKWTVFCEVGEHRNTEVQEQVAVRRNLLQSV